MYTIVDMNNNTYRYVGEKNIELRLSYALIHVLTLQHLVEEKTIPLLNQEASGNGSKKRSAISGPCSTSKARFGKRA